MIQAFAHNHGRVLGFRLSGMLHAEDYETFAPAIAAAIERHGRLRLLLQFEDFHGWDAGALWSDLKFRAQHFTDIERIAFVGEGRRDRTVAMLLRPLTTAELRYFDGDQLADAWAWLEEGTRNPWSTAIMLPMTQPAGDLRATMLQ